MAKDKMYKGYISTFCSQKKRSDLYEKGKEWIEDYQKHFISSSNPIPKEDLKGFFQYKKFSIPHIIANYVGISYYVANKVYNTLGMGFQEAVYQDCVEIELVRHGVPYIREPSLVINYTYKNDSEGKEITKIPLQHTYRPDFIIGDDPNERLVLELKSKWLDPSDGKVADKNISAEDKQVINYLAASEQKYGLLLNFFGKNYEEDDKVDLYHRIYKFEGNGC